MKHLLCQFGGAAGKILGAGSGAGGRSREWGGDRSRRQELDRGQGRGQETGQDRGQEQGQEAGAGYFGEM
jgi:hypothetical protein